MNPEADRFRVLEQIRSVAQLGLAQAGSSADRDRFEEVLLLAASGYSDLVNSDPAELAARFAKDLGQLTPKVGCSAAIFNRRGEILLVRRRDDNRWGLPGGWAEVGETPQQTVTREVMEETGLEVDAGPLIEVFARTPEMFGEPHSAWALLHHCLVVGGRLLDSSDEAAEVTFIDYARVSDWHLDHQRRARRAYRFWQDLEYRAPAN